MLWIRICNQLLPQCESDPGSQPNVPCVAGSGSWSDFAVTKSLKLYIIYVPLTAWLWIRNDLFWIRTRIPDPTLKGTVHKIENFFGSDFEFCVISLLVIVSPRADLKVINS
jgi:hypothetical protein